MLIIFFFFWLFSFGAVVHAQIPTCVNALAASPQGPFPCSVTATWNDNSDNEQGFRLYRRLNGGPWVQLGGNLAPNTNSVIDATLQQSQTVDNVYDYRVEAFNQASVSPGITPVTASFIITKAVAPAKPPTGITVTFKGGYGELTCPTCTGGDKRVPLDFDEGKLVISSAAEITVDIKY